MPCHVNQTIWHSIDTWQIIQRTNASHSWNMLINPFSCDTTPLEATLAYIMMLLSNLRVHKPCMEWVSNHVTGSSPDHKPQPMALTQLKELTQWTKAMSNRYNCITASCKMQSFITAFMSCARDQRLSLHNTILDIQVCRNKDLEYIHSICNPTKPSWPITQEKLTLHRKQHCVH